MANVQSIPLIVTQKTFPQEKVHVIKNVTATQKGKKPLSELQ